MKRSHLLLALFALVSLAGCSQTQGGSGGFFHQTFIVPFISLIHMTASLFDGSYGIAIIIITLIIRLILSPLMLRQYKNQNKMKVKMDALKPEMNKIQKALKETKDPKKQKELQQEMMGLYQKHGVNPLSMGCLPMLIQMPILMAFYYAIRSSHDIASHYFLWFSLGHPDIILTLIAGVVYFFQFKVQQSFMPTDQQNSMKWMGLISPIMIMFVSFNAPAALPLYWSVGGAFLIVQSIYANRVINSDKGQSSSTENA